MTTAVALFPKGKQYTKTLHTEVTWKTMLYATFEKALQPAYLLEGLVGARFTTVAVTATAYTLLPAATLLSATSSTALTGICSKGIPWSLFSGCFTK